MSVCPLYVWPYLRNGSSDQLRFWHAAEGRQARECVPCVAQPACVSTLGEARQRREYNPPDEARQRRVYNAIRVDSVLSCSWAPRGRADEFKMLLLRHFLCDSADILTRWSPTLGKLVVLTDSGSGPCDVSNYIMKFCIGTPTFK